MAAPALSTIVSADLSSIFRTQVNAMFTELYANQQKTYTATLTSTVAGTIVHLIPDADVPIGKKVLILGMLSTVNGATAWSGGSGTIITVQDTAGSPVVGVTFAVANLTANNNLGLLSTGVTLGTAVRLGTGFTASKGLDLTGDANFGAGSPFVITILVQFI